ncbi:hypothetical protein SNOG_13645 [Parastagonospora nodorum SN15]|uniref:Uncharacterized protein n=1 Tax=Phaeosphaeria nodorum (strain SN15 / ATCC MYA-4574 / FGSC 10173) TaxID=321614 RepID=Q0U3L9_PHANO|nr:hypothetical protein SNOG_13645 [Parastagonospora nodorum SN15]EAT79092.1 hypothetical protein SNOG_13645 [Parastagonospora nodorum SN15]
MAGSQFGVQCSVTPMPMPVGRSESGEVSMCGIDELFLRAQAAPPKNRLRRRDHGRWHGKDPLDPGRRMAGSARPKMHKVTTLAGLDGGRALMQGPRFLPKASLSARKVLGFNRVAAPFHRLY